MLPGVSVPAVSGGFASVNPGQIFGGQLPAPFDPSKSLVLAMAPEKPFQSLREASQKPLRRVSEASEKFLGRL